MMQKLMNRKNKNGFTLIELIVVIAIIAILAAVLIPRMSGFTAKAQSTAALVAAKQFATSYDSLTAESKTWSGATGTMTSTTFYTTDVMTLASLSATNGAPSAVDATGSFIWTASQAQGGKTARRTGVGSVATP